MYRTFAFVLHYYLLISILIWRHVTYSYLCLGVITDSVQGLFLTLCLGIIWGIVPKELYIVPRDQTRDHYMQEKCLNSYISLQPLKYILKLNYKIRPLSHGSHGLNTLHTYRSALICRSMIKKHYLKILLSHNVIAHKAV